ncbi:type IV pilus assembly protein PilM [candidate division WOR-3 bacterium]|jgi:type IV pilus assembly protein PilM|nr:type IV pilus assembly protein PilM [candidate division WOR-3 bacterium]
MAKGKIGIGVDIGSSLIKIVEFEGLPKSPILTNYEVKKLASEAIVDGEIMDRGLVINTMKEMINDMKLKNKKVVISIYGKSVIVKRIQMEKMKRSEIAESIKWEAEQQIPFDVNSIELDYAVVNPDRPDGKMDVLLVAAKKDAILQKIDLLHEVGLDVKKMDISSFATNNIYEFNADQPKGQFISLVSVGFEDTSISFIDDGVFMFTRGNPTASKKFVYELQKRFGITEDDAIDIILGKSKDKYNNDEINAALYDFVDSISISIERNLTYLTRDKEHIDKIVLSGGGALIPGFSELLAKHFGTKVEIIDPFAKVSIGEGIKANDIKSIAPIIAEACGLALRAE